MIKKNHWLKLDRHFFKRHDVTIIREMPEGDSIILFYMMLLTESIDHEGYLRINEFIPYDIDTLAIITKTPKSTVELAIPLLKKFKLLEVLDDETYYLTKLESMIGNVDNSTERVQKFREREKQKCLNEGKKEECNVSVTLHETNVTAQSKSKSKIKSKSNNNTPFFQNEALDVLFKEFLELRKTLKAKNTDRAIQLLINELNKYPDQIKKDMIENSIKNSWKSVYPLKAETSNKPVLKNHKVGKYDDLYE